MFLERASSCTPNVSTLSARGHLFPIMASRSGRSSDTGYRIRTAVPLLVFLSAHRTTSLYMMEQGSGIRQGSPLRLAATALKFRLNRLRQFLPGASHLMSREVAMPER